MKKVKICSIILSICILIHSIGFSVSAIENLNINKKTTVLDTIISASKINTDENTKTIATIALNGGIEIKNVNTVVPLTTELSAEAYIPNVTNSQNSRSADSNGLQKLTGSNVDNRVGKLVAFYDLNGDGGIDNAKTITASLQNHDILISCMHHLWMPEWVTDNFDGWPSEIEFYAGQTSNSSSAAVSKVLQYSFDVEYINQGLEGGNYFDGDWAILQIEDNLGGRFGWFGLHGTNEPEIGFSVDIIGYPEDDLYPQYNGLDQYKSSGTLGNLIANNRIYLNMFICKGFSGSPVIQNGMVFGIAVSKQSTNLGTAVRMVPWLFGMILEAREESEARWA